MISMKPVIVILLLLAFIMPAVSAAESIAYGQKFSFKAAEDLEFPDFRLQFVDRRPGPFFPGSTSHRLGDVYEFRVIAPAFNQIVEWPSGTGDIGPTNFKVQKKCFWLELQRSDTYGSLGDNQAVISRRDEPTDCGQDEEAR